MRVWSHDEKRRSGTRLSGAMLNRDTATAGLLAIEGKTDGKAVSEGKRVTFVEFYFAPFEYGDPPRFFLSYADGCTIVLGGYRSPRMSQMVWIEEGTVSQLASCFCLTALRSKKSAWLTSADTVARW
jgi:hypothetical protein